MDAAPGAQPAPARLTMAVRAGCVGLSAFQLWMVYAGGFDPLLHRALFLSITLALIFLTQATPTPEDRPGMARRSISNGILALLSAGAGVYFLSRFEWISSRWPLVHTLSVTDVACGLVLLYAVLEATRRLIGWTLTLAMLAFLAYVLGGHLLSGLGYHRPFSPRDLIDQLVFTRNGLFGAPLAVAATYVYVFILFGTALELSGTGDYLFRLASTVTGRTQGGPAKVAVVSSALYGTISGSPTSNVVTTGLFTIPMMKRVGFRADVAGAVEAVASTGGGLLPPVMGSAAFLMAELTGIPYLDICIAALVPALLFYLSVFMQVHWGAARLGIRSMAVPAGEAGVRRSEAPHLLPLATLVALLLAGFTPITAAGVALAVTVVGSWFRPTTRMGPSQILRLLELGAQRSLLVTAACAAAGVIVGSIVTTGLGGKVTSLIFTYAGGSLLAALFATMTVCILLGMGMPVPSAYVVTAVLAGPPLALLGLTEMSAHLFILYFAVLSAITPPVAVAAYAASAIAEASPTRVALQAVRLGLVAFVVPYFFVYRSELLLTGPALHIGLALLSSTVGVVLLAAALEGFMRSPLAWWERAFMLTAGLCLIFPGWVTDLAGVLLGGVGVRRQLPRRAGA